MFIITQTASLPHPMATNPIPDAWIDADDENKRTLNGADISALANKATDFIVFSQPDADIQPRFQSSGINGLGVMEYVDHPSLEKLNSNNNIVSGPPNFFLQFVWRYTGVLIGTNGYIFSIVFSSGGTVQYLLTIWPDFQKIISRPWALANVGAIVSNLALNQNQAYIIEILYDQSASLHSLTIDGIFQISSNTMINISTDQMNLFTNHPSLTAPQVQYGGLMIQKTIPSELSIRRRRRYLANRYNISI